MNTSCCWCQEFSVRQYELGFLNPSCSGHLPELPRGSGTKISSEGRCGIPNLSLAPCGISSKSWSCTD